MSIYAISDLHLSTADPKPMDVFGEAWENHTQRIAANWDAAVGADDTVLVAGDHSWALRFDEAKEDLRYIAERRGKKILIRGNHDYWWRREATNRIQSFLPQDMLLMHGRAVTVEGAGITGTRGWRTEEDDGEPEAGDARVLNRELMYLERGLREMPVGVKKKMVMLHYPPFNTDMQLNRFADLLQTYKVDILVYGHIHGSSYLEGDINGVEYHLVSVDHTDFRPIKIA